MKEYKVINIYNDSGKTLNEIVNNFLLNFLDNELNFTDSDGIIISDTILNN